MADGKGWDIDKAIEAAGSWGRFQKCVLVMSFFSAIPNAFVALHFVYSQYESRHHCKYPGEYVTYANQSGDNPEIVSTIIPLELNQQNEWVPSQCKMYDRNFSQYAVETWTEMFPNDTKTVDCTNGLSYGLPAAEKTAAMEFSMTCKGDWKAPLAVSMYGIGKAAGCVFGLSADWYGRRTLFIAAALLQILFAVLNALSWSFPIYCLSIVLSSSCSIMTYIIFFVVATEVTDYKWRNFLSISGSFGFAIGYGCVALLAYIFRRWRVFLGSMAALSAVIYLPCCWFFPESPRWLAQKGRSDEAMRGLRQIAKINDRQKEFEEALEAQENKCVIAKNNMITSGLGETIKVFFRSGIASRFWTTVYGWLVCSLVYLAFSIYSTDFSEDRYINFFLNGLVEIPAFAIGFVLLKYIGRPKTAFLLMTICGISSIFLPFIPEDLRALSIALAMFGKGAIAAVFFVWYLISTEVFPTLQRSSAVSICSTVSRVGSFCAPYLMYIRKFNHWVPNVVMGMFCLSCGLFAIFFIPETLGVNLPDTATEARENTRFYRWNIMKKFPNTKDDCGRMSDADEDEKQQMI